MENEVVKPEDAKPIEVVAEATPVPQKPVVWAQNLFVAFADGRKGAFVGAAIMTAAEIKLAPPKLVKIEFSNPYPIEDTTVQPTQEVQPNAPAETGADQSGK